MAFPMMSSDTLREQSVTAAAAAAAAIKNQVEDARGHDGQGQDEEWKIEHGRLSLGEFQNHLDLDPSV